MYDHEFKKGDLLILETGEYSDRQWYGPLKFLCGTSKSKLVEEFRKQWKKDPSGYRDKPNSDDFLPWLIKAKKVKEIENVQTWHVGSYGEFDPD